MSIIKRTINFTNKCQVSIDTSDPAVDVILKELQIRYPRYPSKFGPKKYIYALVDLHMEHTGLLVHSRFIKGVAWITDFSIQSYQQVEPQLLWMLMTSNVPGMACKFLWMSSILCWEKHRLNVEVLCRCWIGLMKLPSIVKCFYGKMILNFEVLLLICMRSTRGGNFELYPALLYRILPWFFALDRYKQARCATIYWSDMELLKHRCRNKHKEFAAGNFSFLKTNKQLSRMALDQLHEQNNKYIKSVSSTTSIINQQDGSALVRWELCRPEICWIIEEFEEAKSLTTY